MSKSIKLKNDVYLDTSGIVHGKVKLNEKIGEVIWTGNSRGGEIINLNVSNYKKLKVKVRLADFISFLEIDLTKESGGITKNEIIYKYGNALTCGGLGSPAYINKCCVVVSSDKTKILGYNFGYANLSSSSWDFTERDGEDKDVYKIWGILEIVGYKN